MNNWNSRLWIGIGLIVIGLLMFGERFGLFRGVAGLLWGLLLLAAAGYFLYRFVSNLRGEWWAAIPGFALAGMGATVLLSNLLPHWSGFFFLGALGLGFFAVYYARRDYWWAMIPGGVLLTLGFIAVLGDTFGGRDTGGVLFLGMGLTFILVAVLASLQWAWIPGIVLLVFGALLGMPFGGPVNYFWPAALIIGGVLLILGFARRTR
ncbi:MAG TPA: hypothetical protein VF784_05145 [Anaerolineales bacterium]